MARKTSSKKKPRIVNASTYFFYACAGLIDGVIAPLIHFRGGRVHD